MERPPNYVRRLYHDFEYRAASWDKALYTNEMTSLVKLVFGVLAANTLTAAPAWAHAADQGFVLLLPTTAYITGGTVTVALTILLLIFARPGAIDRVMQPITVPFKPSKLPWRIWSQSAGALCLALLILIGLRGPTDPQANLLPLVIWTVWWMLLFVVQALVFDIWSVINPFPALHRMLMSEHRSILRLPSHLSIWPAVVLMAAFQGFVLADTAPNDPGRLAVFALGYWAFTLVGMIVFGQEAWLKQVECFSVLFTLIGLIRIVRKNRLGLPGWQLLQHRGHDLSHAICVVIILAAGSFDGLYETFWWLAKIGVNPLEYPGRTALIMPTLIGLYGSILVLTLVLCATVLSGIRWINRPVPFKTAFVSFAITLLPIAVGYHFAHYFVTFLIQIQVVVASLADPLAQGWNLFGLGKRRVLVGFLTVPEYVKMIWFTQASVVVLSHVLAVILCHRTAEAVVSSRRDVMMLQLGLSLLMIFYTIFGLWLLASPRGA